MESWQSQSNTKLTYWVINTQRRNKWICCRNWNRTKKNLSWKPKTLSLSMSGIKLKFILQWLLIWFLLQWSIFGQKCFDKRILFLLRFVYFWGRILKSASLFIFNIVNIIYTVHTRICIPSFIMFENSNW